MLLAWTKNISKDGEKWVNPRYILKVESARSAVGFNAGNEQKKGIKDNSKVFGLSYWKNLVIINWVKAGCQRSQTGKEIQELSFGYPKCKMTVRCFQVEEGGQLKYKWLWVEQRGLDWRCKWTGIYRKEKKNLRLSPEHTNFKKLGNVARETEKGVVGELWRQKKKSKGKYFKERVSNCTRSC